MTSTGGGLSQLPCVLLASIGSYHDASTYAHWVRASRFAYRTSRDHRSSTPWHLDISESRLPLQETQALDSATAANFQLLHVATGCQVDFATSCGRTRHPSFHCPAHDLQAVVVSRCDKEASQNFLNARSTPGGRFYTPSSLWRFAPVSVHLKLEGHAASINVLLPRVCGLISIRSLVIDESQISLTSEWLLSDVDAAIPETFAGLNKLTRLTHLDIRRDSYLETQCSSCCIRWRDITPGLRSLRLNCHLPRIEELPLALECLDVEDLSCTLFPVARFTALFLLRLRRLRVSATLSEEWCSVLLQSRLARELEELDVDSHTFTVPACYLQCLSPQDCMEKRLMAMAPGCGGSAVKACCSVPLPSLRIFRGHLHVSSMEDNTTSLDMSALPKCTEDAETTLLRLLVRFPSLRELDGETISCFYRHEEDYKPLVRLLGQLETVTLSIIEGGRFDTLVLGFMVRSPLLVLNVWLSVIVVLPRTMAEWFPHLREFVVCNHNKPNVGLCVPVDLMPMSALRKIDFSRDTCLFLSYSSSSLLAIDPIEAENVPWNRMFPNLVYLCVAKHTMHMRTLRGMRYLVHLNLLNCSFYGGWETRVSCSELDGWVFLRECIGRRALPRLASVIGLEGLHAALGLSRRCCFRTMFPHLDFR